MAKEFGFSLNVYKDRADAITRMKQGDDYQKMRVPLYESSFNANLGEPSAVYKAARFRAEVWMAEHEKVAA